MAHDGGKGRIDEVLDQQAWLMRLARKLGRDEGAAEELAQESLIAAWARPPRERGGALRAWLRSVVVHRARTGATAERRRREREERSARPESVAAADEIAERLELARRVAAALDELPEAERRAVYLRYYEELSPPDIARAVGAPLGTIKSRLAQGRERLRRKLDREYGERELWVALLAPFARSPLPAPAHSTATLATAGASGPVLLGALAMATKTTVALVAAAALGVSLLTWKPWETTPVPQSIAPQIGSPPVLAEAAALRPANVAGDEAELSQRTELPPETAQPSQAVTSATGRAEITARFASDGAVASGLYGSLEPEYQAWPRDAQPPTRTFELDHEGRTVVEEIEPGAWRARLHGRAVEGSAVEVVAGQDSLVELSIRSGLLVRGLVLDQDDAPLAGAEIFDAREDDRPGRGTLTFVDSGGRFTLRDLAAWNQSGPHTELAARAGSYVSSQSWEAVGTVGETIDIVLRLDRRASALRGRVVDAGGLPVPAARIKIQSNGYAREGGLSTEGLRLQPQPELLLESDADGRFFCDRVPAGQATITVTCAEHPVWHNNVNFEAGRTAELEATLEAGGALEGMILDSNGLPAQDAWVKADRPGGFDDFRSAETDAEGRYRIRGLHAGAAEVHAKLGFGREATAEVTIAAGETTRWDVQLPSSERAAGKLVDESGAPLVGWGVNVIKAGQDGLWYVSARTDAAGSFVLENCPDWPKELEVRLPEPFAAPPVLIAPFPHDEDVTLVVPDRARPSATLSGRLVEPEGSELSGLELWLTASDRNWGKQQVPDRARPEFAFGPLVPGTYRLSMKATGCVSRTLEVLDLLPGEARDLGRIQLERGGLLDVSLAPVDQPGWDATSMPTVIQLLSRDGKQQQWGHPDALKWRSELLPEGVWLLRVAGYAVAFEEVEVSVKAGETTSIDVAIEPGTARQITVEPFEEGERLTVEVFGPDGTAFRGPQLLYGANAVIHGLTAGGWRVAASSDAGRTGELEFMIDRLEWVREPLKIALR